MRMKKTNRLKHMPTVKLRSPVDYDGKKIHFFDDFEGDLFPTKETTQGENFLATGPLGKARTCCEAHFGEMALTPKPLSKGK